MKPASLDWSIDSERWPHVEHSRFIRADGLRWHVQQMGEGPGLVMIHGTGASTHSWRSLAPLLAREFTVIAPDLPGHGFTQKPRRKRYTLPAMASAVGALVDALGIQPLAAIGHSAGAAILIRSCLDGLIAPAGIVSLNGALLPFRGPAGFLFPPLAKLMFLNPLAAPLFARSALDRGRVARLIRGTGSEIDDIGVELYARLFSSPDHVAATLGMMANWDLQELGRGLPALQVPLLLMTAENDKAIAPVEAERIAEKVPGARLARLPALGHLAHEEDAQKVANMIFEFLTPLT